MGEILEVGDKRARDTKRFIDFVDNQSSIGVPHKTASIGHSLTHIRA